MDILIASRSCANSNLDHHIFGTFKRFQSYAHCLEMVHASIHDVPNSKIKWPWNCCMGRLADPPQFSNTMDILIASRSCANGNLDHHNFGIFERFQRYVDCLEMVHASIHDVPKSETNGREMPAWGVRLTHHNFQILWTFWLLRAAVPIEIAIITPLEHSKGLQVMGNALKWCTRQFMMCPSQTPSGHEIATWGAWPTHFNFQILWSFWLFHTAVPIVILIITPLEHSKGFKLISNAWKWCTHQFMMCPTLKPIDRETAAWGAWLTHLNFQM